MLQLFCFFWCSWAFAFLLRFGFGLFCVCLVLCAFGMWRVRRGTATAGVAMYEVGAAGTGVGVGGGSGPGRGGRCFPLKNTRIIPKAKKKQCKRTTAMHASQHTLIRPWKFKRADQLLLQRFLSNYTRPASIVKGFNPLPAHARLLKEGFCYADSQPRTDADSSL